VIDQDTGIVQVDAPVAIVHDVVVRVMEPEGKGDGEILSSVDLTSLLVLKLPFPIPVH
jgi:hypothetical protein